MNLICERIELIEETNKFMWCKQLNLISSGFWFITLIWERLFLIAYVTFIMN